MEYTNVGRDTIYARVDIIHNIICTRGYNTCMWKYINVGVDIINAHVHITYAVIYVNKHVSILYACGNI